MLYLLRLLFKIVGYGLLTVFGIVVGATILMACFIFWHVVWHMPVPGG